MSKRLEQFRKSYHYNELIKKHSLEEVGVWKVRGEDPNCDLGGSHHMPDLGTYQGKLGDIVEMAVELPSFWQWGAGGEISAVHIKKVDPQTTKRRAEVTEEIAMLERRLENGEKELRSL